MKPESPQATPSNQPTPTGQSDTSSAATNILDQIIVEKEGIIPPPHHTKSKPMKLLIGVMALSIIVVLFVVGMNMAKRTKTNKIPDNSGDVTFVKTDPSQDVVQRSDDTLDLTKQINPEQDLRAQQLSAQVGQQMNFSDGISMMVTDTDTAWTSSSVRAASGERFVAVHATIGNRTKKLSKAFDPHTINVKDTAGTVYGMNDAATATVNYQKDINAVVLQPAEQKDMLLVYSVPKSNATLYAFYQASYYPVETQTGKTNRPEALFLVSGSVKL